MEWLWSRKDILRPDKRAETQHRTKLYVSQNSEKLPRKLNFLYQLMVIYNRKYVNCAEQSYACMCEGKRSHDEGVSKKGEPKCKMSCNV
jgi:hypothetical protein